MFALIITVISIALVAILALATLYYGGTAFGKGAARAEASKLLNQGQQLLGAADLFYSENRRWPDDIDELVNSKYLKQSPTAQASGLSEALAAGSTWSMPLKGVPMFKTPTAAQDVCAEVNLSGSLKQRAILKSGYTKLVAQCYGSGTLTTVFKKALDTPLDDPGAKAGDPPTDIADSDWLVPPGSTPASGGGGTGGGSTPEPTEVALDAGAAGPAGSLQWVPLSLNMGTIPPYGEVKNFTVTLYNTGSGDVTLGGFSVSGNGYSYNAFECLYMTEVSGILQPRETCNVSVTFTPDGVSGAHPGTLTVTHDGTGGSASMPLTATVSALTAGGPPPTTSLFVKDTFTDADGTRVTAHTPEIGLNWFSPYLDETGYDDCANFTIFGGEVQYPGWSCSGYGWDRLTINNAVAPQQDYDVSAEFILQPDGTDRFSGLLYGHATQIGAGYGTFGYDSVYVIFYGWNVFSPSGSVDVEIGTLEGLSPTRYVTYSAADVPLQPGKHTLRLVLAGNRAVAYLDTKLLLAHDSIQLTNGLVPGKAGFSFGNQNNWNTDSVRFDNFNAGTGVNVGSLPPAFVPIVSPGCNAPTFSKVYIPAVEAGHLGVDQFVESSTGNAYKLEVNGTKPVGCPFIPMSTTTAPPVEGRGGSGCASVNCTTRTGSFTVAGPTYVNLENTSTANAFNTYSDTCAMKPLISERNSCQAQVVAKQYGATCSIVANPGPGNMGTQFSTVCSK